jgi:hypothetical protein
MNIGTLGGSWGAPLTYSQPLARAERSGSEIGRAVTGVQSVSAAHRVASPKEQLAAERTPWIDKTEQTRLDKSAQRAQEEKTERAVQEKKRAERAKLPPLEGLTLEEVRIILGTLPVLAGYQQQDQSTSAVLDVKV